MSQSSYSEAAEYLGEAFLKISKAMGNVTRLGLLCTMLDKSESSHKDLMFNSYAGPINPASLRHHIKVLREADLVEKGSYKLTRLGERLTQPLRKRDGSIKSVQDYLNALSLEEEFES